MSLTRIGSIGINTGIAFAGVTTIVTLNTANDALSIGATVNVGSGITLGASGDIFATGVTTTGSLVSSTGTFTGDVDIADTIVHTGDTNTKIRFPAADTITAETGGTERLRITSDGKVGINESSPAVFGVHSSQSSESVYYRADSGSVDTIFGSSTALGYAIAGTTSNHALTLWANNAERARIDSSGRVLIGTTTEGEASADNLTIADSGNCGITIRSGASNAGGIYFSDGTSGDAEYRGLIAYNQSSDYLQIFTGAAERLRIDSSGDMGQGTATPTTPDGSNADNPNNGRVFTIYGDSPAINLIHNTAGGGSAGSTDYAAINFGRNGSSTNPYRAVIGYKQVEDILRINSNNIIAFDTGGDINTGERLRIDSSGFMGLGTNDPSSFNSYARNFVVAQSSGDAGITISAEDAGSEYGSLHFSGGTTVRSYIDQQNGSTGRMFLMNKANGYMGFGTNNTEAVRIDSSGKLMVGGTTADGKFAVIDASNPDIAMRYNGTAGGHNTRLMFMDKRGVINAQVANNLQNDGVGTAAAHLEFATATGGTLSTAVRITNDGYVRNLRQPLFGYRGSASWLDISGSNVTLQLSTAVVSSSHYNTSNYRFTAPTTGYYWFGCNLYTKHKTMDTSSPHYISGGMKLNGSYQVESNTIQHYQNAGDGDTGSFISWFRYLNTNDYVTMTFNANGADFQYYGAHCYFYGWLVA